MASIMLAFVSGALLSALALLVLVLHGHRTGPKETHLAKVMLDLDREARRTTGFGGAGK